MRKLFLVSAIVPCVALLVGCPKKNADADAGDDGAAAAAAAAAAVVDAAPAAPAAPAAKNSADVARFPAGEKPVADDDQKIVDPFTVARTSPRTGAVVAAVKAGTDPFKIAELNDAVLITFPDPKDPTVTLMGWVLKTAFTGIARFDGGIHDASVDAAVLPTLFGKCGAGAELMVNIAATPVCRRKCTADKDCRTAIPGACAAGSTAAGHITKVCANEGP
jgi:hypothetical protein